MARAIGILVIAAALEAVGLRVGMMGPSNNVGIRKVAVPVRRADVAPPTTVLIGPKEVTPDEACQIGLRDPAAEVLAFEKPQKGKVVIICGDPRHPEEQREIKVRLPPLPQIRNE